MLETRTMGILVRLHQRVEMTSYPFISSSCQLYNHKRKISSHPLIEMTTKFTKEACADIVSAFFQTQHCYHLLMFCHAFFSSCLLMVIMPRVNHSSLDAGSLPSPAHSPVPCWESVYYTKEVLTPQIHHCQKHHCHCASITSSLLIPPLNSLSLIAQPKQTWVPPRNKDGMFSSTIIFFWYS